VIADLGGRASRLPPPGSVEALQRWQCPARLLELAFVIVLTIQMPARSAQSCSWRRRANGIAIPSGYCRDGVV